jgi:hypothetical protein
MILRRKEQLAATDGLVQHADPDEVRLPRGPG